jgi:hypothetical protein
MKDKILAVAGFLAIITIYFLVMYAYRVAMTQETTKRCIKEHVEE